MTDNIIDTNKPSAGRIYDYLLGGSHNFEIDRQAADQMIALIPFITKFARLQRWALQDIASELTNKRGFDVIIDFASGLPTTDHIHMNVAKGTTVIYSDIDPVVVEYAREILKDSPNVYFFENDACHPEELLNRAEVQEILAGRRKVAIGYWGFNSFLNDEELAHSTRAIYDWVAPGSCLAYNAQAVVNQTSPAMLESIEIYKKMGAPFYMRSLEKHRELSQPWKLDEQGFIPLLDWHGFNESEMGKEDKENFGPFGGGYGAYMTK
jgi:hypothetical protein